MIGARRDVEQAAKDLCNELKNEHRRYEYNAYASQLRLSLSDAAMLGDEFIAGSLTNTFA